MSIIARQRISRHKIGTTQAQNVRRLIRTVGEDEAAKILLVDKRRLQNLASGRGFVNAQDSFRISNVRSVVAQEQQRLALWAHWWNKKDAFMNGHPIGRFLGQAEQAEAIDRYMHLLRQGRGRILSQYQDEADELFHDMGYDEQFHVPYTGIYSRH